jgi:hypothetical protein
MCASRQARHQQPAASCGTGTAAGNAVHQQASPVCWAIPHENAAPQRVQVLAGIGR